MGAEYLQQLNVMLKRLKDDVSFVFNLYIFDTFASLLVKGCPKVLGKSYCNLNN